MSVLIPADSPSTLIMALIRVIAIINDNNIISFSYQLLSVDEAHSLLKCTRYCLCLTYDDGRS